VTRWLALALAGIVALAAAAMAIVYRVTEPGPASASRRPLEEPLPSSLASQPASNQEGSTLEAPPAPGPLAVPADQVVLGPQPPAVSKNPQARSDQLLGLRTQRRGSAMDQQNARETARRARLGLTP
jgi:hypothetical protein